MRDPWLFGCLATTLVVFGCSSPSGGQPTAGTPTSTVIITMNWDGSSVSSEARSVKVTAASLEDSGLPIAQLSLNRPATSGTIDAPVGLTRFRATTYDAPDGAGTALQAVQVDATIVAGQSNTVQIMFPDVTSVTSLSVELSASNLAIGATGYAMATARDSGGSVVTGVVVDWASSAESVATINDDGVITAVAIGEATIAATESTTGLSASATLTVTSTTVIISRLELGPGTGSLPVGARLSFRAEAFDEDDRAAPDAVITYVSSDPSVMSVSTSGQAVAHAVGNATITATSHGLSAAAALSVTPASESPVGVSWITTNPAVRPFVEAFDVSGPHMYAATTAWPNISEAGPSLLSSNDAGATWRPVYSGELIDLGCTRLISLTIDPTNERTLFTVCSNDERLLRSTNSGQRWTEVSRTATGAHPRPVFHPTDPTFVTAGSNLHSTDSGITWNTTTVVNTRWVAPNDPNHWIDYGPTSPAATRISRDTGVSWSSIEPPPPPDRGDERCTNDWVWRGMAVSDSGVIGVVGSHFCTFLPTTERYRHVLMVSNDGQTWGERYREESSSSSSTTLNGTLEFSRSDAAVLYNFPATISPTSALSVSRDGGVTWSAYTSPINLSSSTRVLSTTLPNALMVRLSGPPYNRHVSHDYGMTWTDASLGSYTVTVHQRGNQAYAFGSQLTGGGIQATNDFFQTTETLQGAGLTTGVGPRSVVPSQAPDHLRSHGGEWDRDLTGFLSTDRGMTWNRTDTPSRATVQSPASPHRWYFATSKGDVQRSNDNAASYTYAGTLQNYAVPRVFAPSHSDPDRIYALTSGGVYRSHDAGSSWHWASTNLTSTWQSDLVVDPTNHATLYVGGYFGVHKSTDGGNDWSLRSNSLTNADVLTLAITSDGSTVFAGTASGSIYRSLDAANTWEWVNVGFESYRVTDLAVDPNDDNVVYAATIGGVYKSTDKGSSWVLASAGMYSPFVNWLAIAPDSSTIYAGTQDHGIYRGTPTNETGAAFPTAVLAIAEQVAGAIASREDGYQLHDARD